MRRLVRTLWAEFKLFALQGQLIELAVAVVIGAALTGLIHAVVVDLITPTITYAVTAWHTAEDTAAHTAGLTAGRPARAADAPPTLVAVEPANAVRVGGEADAGFRAVQFQWMVGRYPVGHLIGEAINFTIVAVIVFLIAVKLLGGLVLPAGSIPADGQPATRECPECLSIIPARARRCSHCTAVLDGGRLRSPYPGRPDGGGGGPGRRRPMMRRRGGHGTRTE